MIELIAPLSLEEIIEKNVALFREVNPTVNLDSDSDYYMPVIQAWSEAEMRLRVETNIGFNQFIWMNAVESGLDSVAEMFGVTRLEGSKPYTRFLFSISRAPDVDIIVPSLLLGGDNGATATIESFTLPAGVGVIERVGFLDEYIESSSIKTEQILTTLPYIAQIKQIENYKQGAIRESDEALRERIRLSFAELSTAGPVKAYIKRVLGADSRIVDTAVWDESYGVTIAIYATEYDSVLEDRVMSVLSDEDQRPLTDRITLVEAVAVSIDISAVVKIETFASQSVVQALIMSSLEADSRKIGEGLSIAQIIEMLFVEGVRDVELLSPTESVPATRSEVIQIDNIELSYV